MLSDDVDAFLAYRAATDWSAKTVRTTRVVLDQVVRFLRRRGHRRWATVAAADLDSFLLQLQARGLKATSRDTYTYAARSLFAWLADHGRVLVNPAADLVVLDRGEMPLPPPPLSEAQVARLFDVLPRETPSHLRNRLNVELLYSAGLRCAEAAALDVDDLDFDQRIVVVRAGKNGRPRVVPMLRGLMATASDYLAVRRELLCGPDHGALLLGHLGRRIDRYRVGKLLDAVSKEVGFRIHPHLLRHSIAVHLRRQGMDIRCIQEFLGHADLDTTKTYLRMVPGQLREEYNAAMAAMPVGGDE